MLAARQADGFASLTAMFFCMLCNLKVQDIENLNKRTWPERDVGKHVQLVRQWRDAQMNEEQEIIFKNHGIRWSPLLDLPYWNPILFTAIKPMHTFNAGLFQTHCGDGLTSQSTKTIARPSASKFEKWYEVICMPNDPEELQEQLKSCNKLQLAGSIVEWASYPCQTVSPDEIRLPIAIILAIELNHDSKMAPIRDLSEERIPSEEEQKSIDKCIQQLNDRTSLNTVLQAKKIVLQFICHDYCCMTPKELDNLHTKDELYAAAATWVEEHGPPPKNSVWDGKARSTTSAILGKEIMEAIWADMARTQLPSWVTDVPRNWGTATHGKLNFGGGDDAPEDRKHKLQNFMDLEDIELYEHHIHRYVTDFKTLYKNAKVKPIHHAALHYGNILRGFGPVHTHGAAFYERYIHSMQSENHNMKLGELELMFMCSSAREAKLQALLSDHSEVRERVGELAKTYEAFLTEDVRGTRLAHMVDMAHLTQQLDFAFDETRLRDTTLPDALLDLLVQFLSQKSYRRFGFAGGFLSRQQLGPPIIVDQSNIISHVAVTPLEIRGCKVLHVLPMDRLMQMSVTCAEDNEVDSIGI
ncbi:hypothetical protein EDB89DRAFT_1906338 [Lactarius sanguifluus]|nr:hypothetical protein EDB89DRAFT_1906338 [Lactarius sanguifluus]